MTVSHRKNKALAKPDDGKLAVEPGIRYHCDACGADITLTVRVRCAGGCEDFDVCGSCFCAGVEVRQHKAWHDYRIVEQHAYPIFCEDWGADEELLLIDGCQIYGVGNWADIADHIGNRTKEEVERHYVQVFLEGRDGTQEGEERAKKELEEVLNEKRERPQGHDGSSREIAQGEEAESSHEEQLLPHWRRHSRRRHRSPTPPIGPDMRHESSTTPEEFQQRKRRRIEDLRSAQAAFQAPKITKPLVSAPTSHSEIAGFMPGRLEFDLEYEQDAENLTKDMEFGRVYKFGGELIKTEMDALGGQKAVQGQARMPPSTRGAIGSRTGTGIKGTGDEEGAPPQEKDEEEADAEEKPAEKRKADETQDPDTSMADVTAAPDEEERVPSHASKDKGKQKSTGEQDNGVTASSTSAPAPAPAQVPASAATGAAEVAGGDAAAQGTEEKPGDWDEDEVDLDLKLTVLEMYNERLDRRARRKQFIFERNLVDYKRNNAAERRRPKEERDILNRVRHFAQLQTAQDFEDFVNGLCYEESLRRTAAQLQGWRKAGVTSLHDGLIYEKEKEDRRKKALAIAEGGIAAFPHTGMASGPRQRNETAKIARQREASVVSTTETDDKPQPVRKERTADGAFKAGRKPPRPLDFSSDPNLALLTEAEKMLCSTVRVRPAAYLTIKKQILIEYLRRKGKLSRRDCRTLFKMDVNKLGKIYDVIREEGFLDAASKYGIAGATVEPLPGTELPGPQPNEEGSALNGSAHGRVNGHGEHGAPNGTPSSQPRSQTMLNSASQSNNNNGNSKDPHHASPWRPTATA